MTDDDLMRFADGEADAATAAIVTAAIAADPATAARVARYEAQRVAAAAAFGDVLAEPVPDRLLALLRPRRRSPISPLRERRAPGVSRFRSGRRWRRHWSPAWSRGTSSHRQPLRRSLPTRR